MDELGALAIEELPWDTEHFGVRVGELRVGRASADEVRAVLEASAAQFELVYVRNANTNAMSQDVLETFNGEQTDTRAVFERSSLQLPKEGNPPPAGELRRAQPGSNSSALRSLARQVAEHSRFQNDTRFPPSWVSTLYETWLARSIEREHADEVLVWWLDDEPVGLYTIKVAGDCGTLDLFAVDEGQRGKGIGAALLRAGLLWMQERGLSRASVTTQLSNPVCKLYRGFGYSLAETEDIYHLWPNAEEPAP